MWSEYADRSGGARPHGTASRRRAILDLAGGLDNALHVQNAKEDLCLHNDPGARSFPSITQCLTSGCQPWDGTPTDHKCSGWPAR